MFVCFLKNIKVFIVLSFFVFLLFSKQQELFFSKPERLDKFVNKIEQAESFYLNNQQCCNFKKELIVLDQLYKYKNICDKILNGFALGKSEFNEQDCKRIEEEYLALTKEIIRHLEAHLMKVHGWRPARHFSYIVKPVFYGSGLIISSILTSFLLKRLGIISEKNFKNVSICSGVGGLGIILLWITCNYKDVICRRDKKLNVS